MSVEHAESVDVGLELNRLRHALQRLVVAPDASKVSSEMVIEWLASAAAGLVRAERMLAAERSSTRSADVPHHLERSIQNMTVACRRGALVLLARAESLTRHAKTALEDFIARQPEYFPHDKYRFTSDWFSGHIPEWRRTLGGLAGRPDLRFLEIGSLEGRSACWLLDNVLTHESSELTCIDYFDSVKRANMSYSSEVDFPTPGMLFDWNIARAGAASRVTKLTGRSSDWLPTLTRSSFDFIYVDGSHRAVDVMFDAVLSWRLLRPGGLITFDDYEWQEAESSESHPRVAIDAFMTVHAPELELVHKGYQVTLRKRGEEPSR